MKSNAKERILAGFLASEALPQKFVEEMVAGDGDCGFRALGIDREKLIEVLLPHSGDPMVRVALALDIQELAERKHVGKLDQRVHKKLIARELLTLIANAYVVDSDYNSTITNCYKTLYPGYPACSIDKMLEVIKVANNEVVNEVILEQESLLDAVKLALLEHCCTQTIYERYIKSYKGDLWISRRCAILYGKCTDSSVFIWEHDPNDSSQLVLLESTVSANKEARVVHMLWKNGNHFNRLVPKTEEQLRQEQEAKPKSAQESAEQESAKNQPGMKKKDQCQAAVDEKQGLSKDEAESALFSVLFRHISLLGKRENGHEDFHFEQSFSQVVDLLLYPGSSNQCHQARQRDHYNAVLKAINKDKLRRYQIQLGIKAADELLKKFENSYGTKLTPGSADQDVSATKDKRYYQAILDDLNKEVVKELQPRLCTSLPEAKNECELFLMSSLADDALPEKNKIYLEQSRWNRKILRYVVLNPNDPMKQLSATLDIDIGEAELTVELLADLKSKILGETSKRGHTNMRGEFDTSKMDPHEIYLKDNGSYYIKDVAGRVTQHDYSAVPGFKPNLLLCFHDSRFRDSLRALTIKNGHAQQPGILQTVFYDNEVRQMLLNSDFKGPIPLQMGDEVQHYGFFNEPHSVQTVLLQEDEWFPFTNQTIVYCASEPRLLKNNEHNGEVLSRQEIVGHIRRLRNGSILQESPQVLRQQLGRSIFNYLDSLQCYKPGEIIENYRDQDEAIACFFRGQTTNFSSVLAAVFRALTVFRERLAGDPGKDINPLRLLLTDKEITNKLNDYAQSSKKHPDGAGVIDSLVNTLSSGNDAKSDLRSIITYLEDEAANLCSNHTVIENFLQEVQPGAKEEGVADTSSEEVGDTDESLADTSSEEVDDTGESLADFLIRVFYRGGSKRGVASTSIQEVNGDNGGEPVGDLVFEGFKDDTNDKWLDKIWLDKNLLSTFKKAMEVDSLPTIVEVETQCWYEEREEIVGSLAAYCKSNNIAASIIFEVIGVVTSPDFGQFGRAWRLSTIGEESINKLKDSNTLMVVQRSGRYYRVVPKSNQLGQFVALFSKQGMEKAKKALIDVLQLNSREEDDDSFNYYAFVCNQVNSLKNKLTEEAEILGATIEKNEKNLALRSDDVHQIVARDKDFSSKVKKLEELKSDTLDILFSFLVEKLSDKNPLKIRHNDVKNSAKKADVGGVSDDEKRGFLKQILKYGFTVDSIKNTVSRTLLFEVLEKNMSEKILAGLLTLQPNPFMKDAQGDSAIGWLRAKVIELKDLKDKEANPEQLKQTIEKFNLLLEYVVKKLGGRLDARSKLIEGLADFQRLDQYAQNYINFVQNYLPKHRLDLIKPPRLFFGRVKSRGELLVAVLETLWDRLGEREYEQIIEDLRRKADASRFGFFRTLGSQLLSSTRSFIESGTKVVTNGTYKSQREVLTHRKLEMVLQGEIHDIYSKVEHADRMQKNNTAQHKEDKEAMTEQLKLMQEEMKTKDAKMADQASATEALMEKTQVQEGKLAEQERKLAAVETLLMERFNISLPNEARAEAPSAASAVSREQNPGNGKGVQSPEVLPTSSPGAHSPRFFVTISEAVWKAEGEASRNGNDEAAREVFELDL